MTVSDASRQLYHNFKYINDMDLFSQSGTSFLYALKDIVTLKKNEKVCNRKKYDC